MGETEKALDPSADVRKRWFAAFLAGLLVLAVGAGLWRWLKPSDPDVEAIDAAVGLVAAAGDPPGWATEDVLPGFSGTELTPPGGDPEEDGTTTWETRRGLKVAVDNNGVSDVGFSAIWSLPAAKASAETCDALAEWMRRFVPVNAADLKPGCLDAAGTPEGDVGLVGSAGSEPAADGRYPDGRYLVFVEVGPDREGQEKLIVTLRYDAPDPGLRA